MACEDWFALLALPMVLVPAFLMVSTIRYRSFKSLDLGTRRSYRNLLLVALVIAAIATQPKITLVVLAYTYLSSGVVGLAWSRVQRWGTDSGARAEPATPEAVEDAHEPAPEQGVSQL